MGKLYNAEYYRNLQLKKEAQVLKPLLLHMQLEEKKAILFLNRTKSKITLDFRRPLIICSQTQIYKSFSVFGIVTFFDRQVKYQLVDLANLLDIWYNQITITSKDDILNTDILIIRGRTDEWKIDNKIVALIELVGIRKMKNKPTWLFMEELTLAQFKKDYPGVHEAFGQALEMTI